MEDFIKEVEAKCRVSADSGKAYSGNLFKHTLVLIAELREAQDVAQKAQAQEAAYRNRTWKQKIIDVFR